VFISILAYSTEMQRDAEINLRKSAET